MAGCIAAYPSKPTGDPRYSHGMTKPASPADIDSFTLLLRKTRVQACIEGLDSKIWDDAEDDFAILDGDTRVGRIYRAWRDGERQWQWCLQTDPAPPPNVGIEKTLDECKAAFKRRYAKIRDRHGPGR